eukprot:92588_1
MSHTQNLLLKKHHQFLFLMKLKMYMRRRRINQFVIILVLKSDNLGVKSNITTGGNFHTQTQEGRIIVNNIINHYTRNNISMKPNYTNIFDEPDIGPFEAFDFYSTGNTKPTRRIATNYPTAKPTVSPMSETFYPGGWYYGWTYMWWSTVNYALMNNQTPGGWQVNLPFEIHVKYGDKLVFRKVNDWGIDDLLIVSKEMFETCNFS